MRDLGTKGMMWEMTRKSRSIRGQRGPVKEANARQKHGARSDADQEVSASGKRTGLERRKPSSYT